MASIDLIISLSVNTRTKLIPPYNEKYERESRTLRFHDGANVEQFYVEKQREETSKGDLYIYLYFNHHDTAHGAKLTSCRGP